MKEKMLIAMMSLILIPSLALAADPITNLQAIKPFPTVMYGGETHSADYQFYCNIDKLPTIVNLKITSDYIINSNDFIVEAFVNDDKLNCDFVNGTTLDIKCYNGTSKYPIPLGTNHVYFNITSMQNIRPDNYTFSLNFLGEPIPVKSFTNTSVNFIENETTTVEAADLDTTLEITTNTTTTGSINMIEYDTVTSGGIAVPALNKYIEIEASHEIEDSLTWVIIKIKYTDAEVATAGIDESTLRLHYYNETSGIWMPYNPPEGGVNTSANYVWANTTHFSLWGIFGNLIPSAPSPSPSPTGGFGYVIETTTTTLPSTTVTTSTIPTTPTTIPTTTTTIPTATNPITGFATFVSSPSGISLLLSLIVVTALAIVFYKKRRAKKKVEEKIIGISPVE